MYVLALTPKPPHCDPRVSVTAHFELNRCGSSGQWGVSSPFACGCLNVPSYLPNRMKALAFDLTSALPHRSARPPSPSSPSTAALQCPCTSISNRTVATLAASVPSSSPLSRRTQGPSGFCPALTSPPRSRTRSGHHSGGAPCAASDFVRDTA